MEHVTVIKKLIAGGKGLGLLADGMVVMVPGVLAGETVRIAETKAFRGHREARLVQILEAAPERIEPPCPYYPLCGGCNLQHASYPAQLEIKQRIVQETFERARVAALEMPLAHTLPSPEPFNYRHRVRLHLDQAGQLGFHQSGSNQVVPIRRCLLATGRINQVIAALVDAGWPARLHQRFESLELLQCPASGRVLLILHQRQPTAAHVAGTTIDGLEALADLVHVQQEKTGRSTQQDNSKAELVQQFDILGHAYQLRWDSQCFFQVNAEQNPRLIETALGHLPDHWSTGTHALDLFCGMGNFSIPLGLLGARVTGIEHNRSGIGWAEQNSRQAGLNRAHFIAADVEQHLEKIIKTGQTFDSILLDPPRQGLGKAAALLPLLKPRHIVYVSCDPATLARDLNLIIRGGYRLNRTVPVDMFPQTHHIESASFLERN